MLTIGIRQCRGFSLIELMIGLSIAALLLILAAPGYTTWVANQQIHSAAESIVNGLRTAQSEAIKTNGFAVFTLDTTLGTGGWTVANVAGTVVNQATFAEGSGLVQVTTNAGTTVVTFTGLGAVLDPDPAPGATITQVNVRHSILPVIDTRELTVLIGGGRTGIKICDPKWTVIDPNDPKACPP